MTDTQNSAPTEMAGWAEWADDAQNGAGASMGDLRKMSVELREAIEKARDYIMSPYEQFEQRVSFIYGQQDYDNPNPRTKDEIRAMLFDTHGYPRDEDAHARIAELEAQLAANEADMPTIDIAPVHKGYRTHERPMTPAEAKRTIDDYSQRVTALEAYIAAEPDRMRELVERCAKVADDHAEAWGLAHSTPAIVIAAAIRAQELTK